jgi:protein SCO1/2
VSRLAILVVCVAAALTYLPSVGHAHGPGHGAAGQERLPTIGPAADFSLISSSGDQVALQDMRGKIVVVAFIYTSCTDVCPLLTEKMAQVRDKLGPDFGGSIAFVSITVDPERDTPEVLKGYAEAFGADRGGWHFLTGEPTAIREVARRYGVVISAPVSGGDIGHTLLTSLIDRHGTLRVQYLGYRFDPEEFRHDLVGLMNEP